MNDDFLSLFKDARAKCEQCKSQNLLLFVETRIENCVAWACYDCKHFEIRATPEQLKQYFKNKNDSKRLS